MQLRWSEMTITTPILDDELVLEPECHQITRLHPTTRWRMEQKGLFPKRFKIGDPNAINGKTAWSRNELTAWLKARKDARRRETGVSR
jgi:predicted DNA-binding transcriptional regulator AlpA